MINMIYLPLSKNHRNTINLFETLDQNQYEKHINHFNVFGTFIQL